MTKRSGNHKAQKERRKQAVASRQSADHVVTQVWVPRRWLKRGVDYMRTQEVA